MSDAYGKGIVRGQAENTNLRVHSTAKGVTYLTLGRLLLGVASGGAAVVAVDLQDGMWVDPRSQ